MIWIVQLKIISMNLISTVQNLWIDLCKSNKSNYDAYELTSTRYNLLKLDNIIYLDWNIFQIGRSKKRYIAWFELCNSRWCLWIWQAQFKTYELTRASQNMSNYDAYELTSASYNLVKSDNITYLHWNIF